MHGCDPNWGRIISSAGAAMAGRSLPDVSLRLCELEVVKGGEACAISDTSAAALTEAMKDREIDILLDLGLGSHCAELFFADMGHDYITINAEYHS
jgi:glutamate N-acetyltransferase/amino-acid N-acetyltransferase